MEEIKKEKIKRYFKMFLSFFNIVNWYYFIKRFFINLVMKEKFLRYYEGNFHELYKLILVQYVKKGGDGNIEKNYKKRTMKYVLTQLCTANDLKLKKLGIDFEQKGAVLSENINYTNFLNLRKRKYEEFYKEAENNINKVINFIIGAMVLGLVNGFFSSYFSIYLKNK